MPLPDTTLPASLLGFAIMAVLVWYAGARLAYLADALSDRLHLAKSLIGLLFLSLATSLPEVATTLTAALQVQRDLVLNNLFGGITLQTAILALVDFKSRGSITAYPRKANHALEAALLILLLSVTLIVIQMGERASFAGVGAGSLVIATCYAGTIWLLRRYDDASDWVPVDLPDPEPLPFPAPTGVAGVSERGLMWRSAGACLIILVAGLGLVGFSERIAVQSGLGASFIGVTMLAAATSLPEVTTSLAAVRIGAFTLAISNIFGSNLIMLVLVFPADILFREGPILADASDTVSLALGFGILVTAIYMTGMIVRRKPRLGRAGVDSALVIVAFVMSLIAYYLVR